MIIKTISQLFLICITAMVSNAQVLLSPKVICTTGGLANSGGVMLTYTIGEPATYTLSGGVIRLSEGFEQAYLPVSPILGDSALCMGATTTLSDSMGGGTWGSNNTVIATIDISGVVTAIASGLDTITYIVGSDTVTKTITINPLPNAGIIVGPSEICPTGGTFHYTDIGGFGSWGSLYGNIVIESDSGYVVSAIAGATDYITYTSTTACGTVATSFYVTIDTGLPNAGTLSGVGNICRGAAYLFSTSGDGGGTWHSSNATIATVNSSGSVTGIDTGVATISYTVTNGCGTEVATSMVTINTLPNAGAISGLSEFCYLSSVSFTSNGDSGGTWGSSDGLIPIDSLGIVNSATPNIGDVITYTVSNNCGADSIGFYVIIDSLPYSGIITGPTEICSTGSYTYYDTSYSLGGLSAVYGNIVLDYSGNVISAIPGTTDVIQNVFSNTCGTAVSTLSVTVDGAPNAGIITGLSSVCVVASISLSDTASGGAWSVTNAHANVVGGLVTGSFYGIDTIMYSASNACGSAITTKIITINPLPDAGIILGATPPLCAGTSTTLTETSTGGSWSSSNSNATVVEGVVTGVNSGADSIIYTISNSCGTAIAAVTISILPIPSAGVITGLGSVCVGDSIVLVSSQSGGVWSSQNTNANVIIGRVTGIAAGTDSIFYTYSNLCGTDVTYKVMTINTIPNAGVIIGVTDTVCSGSSIILTDAASGGTWVSSDTAEATVVGGMVTGLVGAMGIDTIKYVVGNVCGIATDALPIYVNPLPHVSMLSGIDSVCTEGHITLTDSVSGGIWSCNNARATVLGGVVTGVLVGMDTVKYTVSNFCGNITTFLPIQIITTPNAGIITGHTGICIGNMDTLSNTASGGAWSSLYPSIATISATNGIVTSVASGIDTIEYSVSNTCGMATTKFAIYTDTVIFPIVSGFSFTCISRQADTIVGSPAGGIWAASNDNVAWGEAMGMMIDTGVHAGIDTISYSISNACGTFNTSISIMIYTKEECDSILSTPTISNTEAGKLIIFPNPNTGVFTLSLPQTGFTTIVITNLLGKQIAQKQIDATANQLVDFDLSSVASGTYFVAVSIGNRVYREKIVVIKD